MLVYCKTRREAETYVDTKLGDSVKKLKLEQSTLGWAKLIRRQYQQKGKTVAQIVNLHNAKTKKQTGFEIWIAESLVS
jgi:hypothetical protein